MNGNQQFDVIVVGSGTGGASVARELSRAGRKVLLLERGGEAPKKLSLFSVASVSEEVKISTGLSTTRVLATGGCGALYFGVAYDPPFDVFRSYGIDIEPHIAEVRRELPIAPLAEEHVSEQSRHLREAARAVGLKWEKHDIMIDQSKIDGGYTYDALWRATRYVEEAVANGTRLITHAEVTRIVVEGERATGVECRIKSGPDAGTRIFRAPRIVLAAGELATPHMLRANGIGEIGDRGFYCNPGYALYGLVPGLNGRDNFVGSMGAFFDDGSELGDATLHRFMQRLVMASKFKLRHLFSYPQTIGVSVKIKDGYAGGFTAKGGLHKDFDQDVFDRLKKKEQEARRVLEQAGARHIFNFGLVAAGRVGGLVRLGEHLNADLETRLRGLHVCDGSAIPEEMRGPPSLTLLGMSKHLASRLMVLH